jgi:hypothetical protein
LVQGSVKNADLYSSSFFPWGKAFGVGHPYSLGPMFSVLMSLWWRQCQNWPWPYCDWHIHHGLMVHKCRVQDARHALRRVGHLLDTYLRFRKHPKPVTISILCTVGLRHIW